jgi:hypothetical protein
MTVSEGGLLASRETGKAYDGGALGTVPHRNGKYYFEVQLVGSSADSTPAVGLLGGEGDLITSCRIDRDGLTYCSFSTGGGAGGTSSGGGSSSGAPLGTFESGDVVGVAADLDDRMLHFTVNGTPLGDVELMTEHVADALPPMRPRAEPASGTGFLGTFSTFQFGPPAGYDAWNCTP